MLDGASDREAQLAAALAAPEEAPSGGHGHCH
jgi:hypothetical protein